MRPSRTTGVLLTLWFSGFVLGDGVAAMYDPAADFSAGSNPNGPWSYGYRDTASAAFTPVTATFNYGTLDAWARATTWPDDYPTIQHNGTATPYDNGSGYVVPVGGLDLAPDLPANSRISGSPRPRLGRSCFQGTFSPISIRTDLPRRNDGCARLG